MLIALECPEKALMFVLQWMEGDTSNFHHESQSLIIKVPSLHNVSIIIDK